MILSISARTLMSALWRLSVWLTAASRRPVISSAALTRSTKRSCAWSWAKRFGHRLRSGHPRRGSSRAVAHVLGALDDVRQHITRGLGGRLVLTRKRLDDVRFKALRLGLGDLERRLDLASLHPLVPGLHAQAVELGVRRPLWLRSSHAGLPS
jgi:hypothetical protein